jgi:flagellar biogenesis protein FliO
LLDQIVAVVFVLGLLGAALWVARRRGALSFGGGSKKVRAGHALQVLERVPLTAQHTLHLVRHGQETLLVATYPGGAVFAPRGSGFEQVFREVSGEEQPK